MRGIAELRALSHHPISQQKVVALLPGEVKPASIMYPQPWGWVRGVQRDKAPDLTSGVPQEVTGFPSSCSPPMSPARTQLPTSVLVPHTLRSLNL